MNIGAMPVVYKGNNVLLKSRYAGHASKNCINFQQHFGHGTYKIYYFTVKSQSILNTSYSTVIAPLRLYVHHSVSPVLHVLCTSRLIDTTISDGTVISKVLYIGYRHVQSSYV
jgi:hypothetical protein